MCGVELTTPPLEMFQGSAHRPLSVPERELDEAVERNGEKRRSA
jgi:hypothetical protein